MKAWICIVMWNCKFSSKGKHIKEIKMSDFQSSTKSSIKKKNKILIIKSNIPLLPLLYRQVYIVLKNKSDINHESQIYKIFLCYKHMVGF